MAIADYVGAEGHLSASVIQNVNDYLRQSLERESLNEDEIGNLRSKFIESLVTTEKQLSLELLRNLHESNLEKPGTDIERKAKGLIEVFYRENRKSEYDQGIDQTVKYKDGTIYEGTFRGGKKNGMGKLTFPNGDTYTGQWLEGERHGHGIYIWKSGAKYEGEYSKNQRNGIGTFTFADGKIYQGEWKDGLRNGKGKLVWENGDSYEGEFLKSHRTGKGVFRR